MKASLSENRWTVAGLVAMVVTAVAMVCVARIGVRGFPDFDLYYYAGLVERHGTYTDGSNVARVAAAHHTRVSPVGAYGSPILVGLVYQPISFLPLPTAHLLWDVFAIGLMLFAMQRTAGRQWAWWTTLLFSTYLFTVTYRWANFHLVTLALLILAFGYLKKEKGTHAGVALGLAIAFKLYPAVLLVPLLFSRKWRTVVVAIATPLALFVVAVPALGWSDTFTAWHSQLSLGGAVSPIHFNVGAPAFVLHATDSQTLARVVGIACVLAGVGILYACRKATAAHLFALAVPIMLLSQTISWNYYATLLIIALMAVAERRDTTNTALAAIGFAAACIPGYVLAIVAGGPWLDIAGVVSLVGLIFSLVAFLVPEDSEDEEVAPAEPLAS